MAARTVVEILNSSLSKVAEVKSLYPLTESGMVLRYSKELSDYGTCTFRVSTKDPLLTQFGDILQPHRYHIRIRRGSVLVWSGAIVDNTERNKNYIEVRAVEYLFYLDKILIRRDTVIPSGANSADDSWKNYRTFSSGTMAAAVTTLIQNAATDFGSAHILGAMTAGTIDNPNYPLGFVNASGVALTGAWNFSDFVTLQFDYHSVYYVLKAFGVYTNCDFEIDENLVFNFRTFLGNKLNGLTFRYGTQGNIIDYNVPRLGKRMVNDLWGIAAETDGTILNANQRDETAIQTYGLLQDSSAFSDVKDANFLKTRMAEELRFLKDPEVSPINITLDEKAYALGQYSIGDIVTVAITDHVIAYQKPRRIVGITVNLHNTGREITTIQTNAPREADMGGP